MKTAILQVGDTSPLESLVMMLRYAGYECYTCDDRLQGELRSVGCDTVVSTKGLVENWGYEYPSLKIGEASPEMMSSCDLYVDVKAHRNGSRVWSRWPRLTKRTLWYRINGSQPEHVIRSRNGKTEDCGDEVNPPCPILTPNMWYDQPGPWSDKAYAMWPPFYEINRYSSPRSTSYKDSICLIHNLNGWGYAALTSGMREMGVKLYGRGTIDGLVPHAKIPEMLKDCLAMVHLKSSDAPGYALYEALAASCPVIVTRRLIWRCAMHELLIPNETCLVFDRETHDPLSDQDVTQCIEDVRTHLLFLREVRRNREIGEAGRKKLEQLMWNPDRDGASLKAFMEKHYG